MTQLQMLFAMFLPVALILLSGNTSDTIVAAVIAGVAVLTRIGVPTAAPARVRAISLRERARQSVFLRLRDPDAAGRPRPRAPGAALAAA
ncbi:DUF6412 domain-containing protein [Kibdelosporangium philippinense]|uniref:DUF6412 domain-containing protein n=1 Tax=Kibdelosporangium philippinense TaxID=211113 RepID=A0ABS8Z7E2_9PSEU|nr:DUF6412 domain-containing protein [Kibdelosporangium philippinense]MCE7002710.1 DUF6412 domain-containing protein [Kibdelosporangium philippinense]